MKQISIKTPLGTYVSAFTKESHGENAAEKGFESIESSFQGTVHSIIIPTLLGPVMIPGRLLSRSVIMLRD